MKALLDTNILLDAIASRAPFSEAAQKIFLLAAQGHIEGYITANSMTDIYYITRKSLSDNETREALYNLLQIFNVIDVCGKDCKAALSSPVADFEDAVVSECGKKAQVDFIVTRDEDFQNSKSVPVPIDPTKFLEKCNYM